MSTNNFTNQKRRVATEAECNATWRAGTAPGEFFRCHLCGHKFVPGDGWRFVFATAGSGCINFMTCDACDGDDVLERWIQMNREFMLEKYWALRRLHGR